MSQRDIGHVAHSALVTMGSALCAEHAVRTAHLPSSPRFGFLILFTGIQRSLTCH